MLGRKLHQASLTSILSLSTTRPFLHVQYYWRQLDFTPYLAFVCDWTEYHRMMPTISNRKLIISVDFLLPLCPTNSYLTSVYGHMLKWFFHVEKANKVRDDEKNAVSNYDRGKGKMDIILN